MELSFKNEVIQYDAQKQPTVEDIIVQINEWIRDDYYFSHLVIDGFEIYEHLELCLEEKLTHAQKIEVMARTNTELINDILLSSDEYIKRAIPELNTLFEEFYQNPLKDSWMKFEQMIEGIQWLHQMIRCINQFKERLQNGTQYIQIESRLEMEIQHLEEAVENEDNVLIADLIQYEIITIYEALKKEIQLTIDTEGLRYDVN